MPLTLTPATGFITCVGADAWGLLRSLSWYAAQRPDGVACLFVTEALIRSKEAADILRRVSAKRWPRLKVIISGESSANTAKAFSQRFTDWKVFHPELATWIIDASYATLPVRDALSATALADPSVTLIASERDDTWWRFDPDPATGMLTAISIAQPPTEALDNGPLTDLLEPFCLGEAEVRWRDSRAPLALSTEQVTRMVGAGVASNWNWREMVSVATGAPCKQYDYDLRDFLATVLHAMGVPHVRLNVQLAWTSFKEEPLTLDVVFCHHGCLYLFDCQTATEQEGGTSPRVTDIASAIFSRLHVIGVVLRPNRWATGAERTLSALTPAARLFGANDCRQLFSRLGALLDIPVPQALREAERALHFGGRKLPVMTAASDAQRVGAAVTVDERIYDVWRGAHAADASNDWPWRAMRVSPDRWFLQGRIMQGGQTEELRHRLAARFTADRIQADIRFFELSSNRRFWHALLTVPGEPHLFPRWLRKWEKVPLIV